MEWHLYTAVVDEAVVHLKIGLLAGFIRIKPQERVAQRVASFPIADDVARGDVAKSGEDYL